MFPDSDLEQLRNEKILGFSYGVKELNPSDWDIYNSKSSNENGNAVIRVVLKRVGRLLVKVYELNTFSLLQIDTFCSKDSYRSLFYLL